MTDLERAQAIWMEWIDGPQLPLPIQAIADALAAARREGAEEAETEAFIRGREAGLHLAALEDKYGSFDAKVQAQIKDAERHGAEEMRERAAAECERHAKFCEDEAHKTGDWGHLMTRFEEATYNAQSIRALPLTPEEPQA